MRDSAKKQKCKDAFEGRVLLPTPLCKPFNQKPQGQLLISRQAERDSGTEESGSCAVASDSLRLHGL